jgi:ribose transport system substrate-binding protein
MVSRNWKKTLFVVAALFAMVSVAAFAGGQGDKGGATGVVNAKGNILSIAAVDFPQFQPYKIRTESEKKACDDYGIKYTLLQPQQVTVEGYLETLTNAINQDFDAILCEPWDFAAFKPVLELAKKKGIPLVSVHQQYPDPSYFISMLYINNSGYGATAADELGRTAGGKANVLFMMYQADTPNQATIRQTFIDRSKEKWPNIKVVDTQFTRNDTMNAAKILEATLKAYPEIDTAIWLEGATVTVGVDVAKEMGLIGKLKIIGVDDPPDVIAAIGKGEAWGSFVQNFWKQGYEGVRNIVDYYTKQPFPKETDCGVVLVNKTNWDNYLPTMWAPVAVKGKPYPKQ